MHVERWDRRPYSTSPGNERFPTTVATETVGAWGKTQVYGANGFHPKAASKLDSPHAQSQARTVSGACQRETKGRVAFAV